MRKPREKGATEGKEFSKIFSRRYGRETGLYRPLRSIPRAQGAESLPRVVQRRFIQRRHARGGIEARARKHLGPQLQLLQPGRFGLQLAQPGLIAAPGQQKPLAVRAVANPSVTRIAVINER